MAEAKAARKKARKPAKKAIRSHLESKWIREWQRLGGPALVEEYEFHPTRKWRADFAHIGTRTLIEIEGGAAGGRHTRVSGFKEDLTKYLTAYLHGWTVVRIGAHQITSPIIQATIGALRSRMDSAESSEHHGPTSEIDRQHWLGSIRADRMPEPQVTTTPRAPTPADLPAWLGGGEALGLN